MIQSLVTRAGIGVLIVGALAGAAYWQGGKSARADLDQERRDHRVTKGYYAQILKDAAARAQHVADLARAASEAVRRDRAETDQRFTEQADASTREIDDLRRHLRAGDVQLQPWWSCPATGPEPGDAAALAGGQDAAADLRLEGALAHVADADHADRWIGWLQDELTSTRDAVKAAGCAVEAAP